LLGISALAILLQGLWAGLFLEHDGGRAAAGDWIDVHARGGEIALIFAIFATFFTFAKCRERKDLWIGSGVLAGLLVIESYLGGWIRDRGRDSLTAIHVPLGMVLMGLVVWLSVRAAAPE
jgi:heme A synthase